MTRTIASHMPYATACEETIKSHTGERIPQGGNLNLVKFHLTTHNHITRQNTYFKASNSKRTTCVHDVLVVNAFTTNSVVGVSINV